MVTKEQFEKILERPESSVLDFKKQLYDFGNDKDLKATSSFIKDIISFSNTIRAESAFIIFGVEEKSNGDKEYSGIEKSIDDAILQDKLKDKVMPKPLFYFQSIKFKGTLFGIIEIPVQSYDTPIYATQRLKGLEEGKIYFRRNTSNSEANGIEVIQIHKWLDSIKDSGTDKKEQLNSSTFLNKLSNPDNLLAPIITEVLQFAKSKGLDEINDFCKGELLGWDYSKIDDIENQFNYRTQNIIFSPTQIEFNPMSPYSLSSSQLHHELLKRDDFFEYKIRFSQPITELENFKKDFERRDNGSFLTWETTANQFINLEKFGDMRIIVYIFSDNIDNLVMNIRQKLIDKLLRVMY